MANTKEAQARIKINKLLEESGWRFFDDADRLANISLEPNVKLNPRDIDAFGQDFENVKKRDRVRSGSGFVFVVSFSKNVVGELSLWNSE